MPAPEELLAAYLAGFEISALTESLAPRLASEALARLPGLRGACDPAQLEALLAAAAAEGVGRFFQAAELHAAVEGFGPDESHIALGQTVAVVRTALELICGEPGEAIEPGERIRRSHAAIGLLERIVASWDASNAPSPGEPIEG